MSEDQDEMCRIVNTDNFGGDYPDESFVNLPNLPRRLCKQIADIVNEFEGERSPRYYKVERHDYRLQPGFEP